MGGWGEDVHNRPCLHGNRHGRWAPHPPCGHLLKPVTSSGIPGWRGRGRDSHSPTTVLAGVAIQAEPQSCLISTPDRAFQITKLSTSLLLKALQRVPGTVLPGGGYTFPRQSPVQHPPRTSRAPDTLNRVSASQAHLGHMFLSLCTHHEYLPPSAYRRISTSAPSPVRLPLDCPPAVLDMFP